jgi:origin recognition complex subunit 3
MKYCNLYLSLHVPRIPLVFILSLSSPSSPSYLHIAYSRSTLALLRIRNFVVPSGPKVLEEVLLKVPCGFIPAVTPLVQ